MEWNLHLKWLFEVLLIMTRILVFGSQCVINQY